MSTKVIKIYNGNYNVADLTKKDALNATIENRQNDESKLSFTMKTTNPKYSDVDNYNTVFVADNRAYIHMPKDNSSEEKHTVEGKKANLILVERHYELGWKYVTAYNSTTGYDGIDTNMVVVLSGGILPLNVNGQEVDTTGIEIGSAEYALTAILYGSGWSVGTVDVEGTYDLETDKISILENLKKIIELWGGILVIDSMQKTISLRNEETYTPKNGFEVKCGYNAKTINKQVSRDIATKAYVYGKDNLTISSVNDGLNYLENHDYIAETRETVLTNNDIADPTKLKEWGEKELAKLCRVRSKISADFIDKSFLTGGVTFSTSDIVNVYDDSLNVDYEARVLYKKYNYFMPFKCSAEFGDNLKNGDDVLNNVISTSKIVNDVISTNKTISSNSIYVPDKTSVTAILANHESAIYQTANEISIVQNNSYTKEQINSLVESSSNISGSEIEQKVYTTTTLNSTVYHEQPLEYQLNDIYVLDKTYVSDPANDFAIGEQLIAISAGVSTPQYIICENGDKIFFYNSETLVVNGFIPTDWDRKSNVIIDDEKSTSLKQSTERFLLSVLDDDVSKEMELDLSNFTLYGVDFHLYNENKDSETKSLKIDVDLTNNKVTFDMDLYADNIYSNGVQVTSDRTKKCNIKKVNVNALDKLKNIGFYSYEMLDNKQNYSTDIGMMYDECPKEVCSNNGTNKTIDLYALQSLSIKAIQELSKKVSYLEKENTKLKRRNK